MPTMAETINAAETLLKDSGYSEITLEPCGQKLSGRDWPRVIRTRASGHPEHTSVIIRTFKDWAPYDPDDPTGPASGLFAEWAALEFLNERLADPTFISTVLAGDRDLGVVVMTDFGPAQTLDEVLRSDYSEAKNCFKQLAKALAQIHGASIGQQERYRQIYTNLGPLGNDTTCNTYIDQAVEVLKQLDIKISREDQALINQVTTFVTTPNEWTGLRHLEPGADNLILVDGEIRIIDFEGSGWSNVLRDVAFPSMAFGHLTATHTVPEDLVSQFETSYFECIEDTSSGISREGPKALNLAKIGLALEVLGAYYSICESEEWAPWGGARCRSQIISQWQTIEALPVSNDLAKRVLNALYRVWQEWEPQPLPEYCL